MSIYDGKLNIEVAAASGIEAVVKRELINLGYSPKGANLGRIIFEGNYLDVMRANMFLRCANRVRIVIASFRAVTFDELFDGIYNIDWQEVMPKNASVGVTAKTHKSALFSPRSIQSITKMAIVKKLQSAYHAATLDESGERYDIEVSISDNAATVTLDTTGDGLHKRGYRTYLGDAPIRETLAAAMIELSYWNPSRIFVDPFCGSGTIPIEAALQGRNIASGINRSFAMERFSLAPNVRKEVQDEAEQLIYRDGKLKIFGFDNSESAVNLSLKHAKRAGVASDVTFKVQNMQDFTSKDSHGIIVCNPPYAKRLMNEGEIKSLYKDFGEMTKKLDDWCVYVITSFIGFEKYYGKKADRIRKLYNSELECNFYSFLAPPPDKRSNYESIDTAHV